jgi:hypothetical protein
MRMVLQMYHIHKMQYGIPVLGIMVIGMAVLHTTWTLNPVTWYGILDEIQVIKINDNSLELNGIFKFKIGDYINTLKWNKSHI